MVFPIDLQPTPVSMISMVSIMIVTTVNDCIYSSDMMVFSLASISAVNPAFNWRLWCIIPRRLDTYSITYAWQIHSWILDHLGLTILSLLQYQIQYLTYPWQ